MEKMQEKSFILLLFLYDTAEETLSWDYAAKVGIRDTGYPSAVTFGNGMGRNIPENVDWRNDTTIEPVSYQESIVPLYDINNPDLNQ